MLVTILAVLAGAASGYAVHRFVGCRSGACPIWASPYTASLYGGLLGLMLGLR
jgi:hypothetical protein